MDYYNDDYLMHYGVKGMKWSVRRNRGVSGTIRDMQRSSANKSLSKINAKRKQVDSELKELRGYDKNPSGLGKSKVSTAIRRNQIKSLEKTRSKLDAKAKDNKDALKELDSIEKHKQAKKEAVKKVGDVAKDHTGVDNHIDKKDFVKRRREVAKSRTTGAKLATNLLAGPFANRTYNSVIAAGGSKAGAIGVTAATAVVGGPVGHLIVSALYTNNASEKSYRE